MNEELNYKKDLEIDKFNLDEECENQPRKFAKWAEKYIETKKERDKIKQKIKVKRAEVEKNIRYTPEDYGLNGKITEAMVKAEVELHREVQELENELIEKNYEVGILEVAKEAFQDRKKELENEIGLYIGNYWSTPNPKIVESIKKEIEDKTENEQKTKLKKNERLKRLKQELGSKIDHALRQKKPTETDDIEDFKDHDMLLPF